MMHCSRLQQWL